MKRTKVLIVKPGYSETLDPDTSGVLSLGDVIRSTVILHLFPREKYHVTWLVDEQALPLLTHNPAIDRILKVNAFTPFHLMKEMFDIVINLEKDPGICAMAEQVPAWHRYGFRLDPVSGLAEGYMHADEALLMTRDETYKQRQKKSWSEVLYGMLGERYAGQPYMLGYRPKTRETYDIGLNHHVGSKFPNKRWPEENWNRLAEMLAPRYSVDWQRSMNELEGYMDWINSCLTIVTNDSLGLHIALALGKNVVALFGPTLASEVHDRPNLCKIVSPNRHLCADCSEARCVNDPGCMAGIPVEEVLNEVEALSFDQLRSNVHKIPAKGVA